MSDKHHIIVPEPAVQPYLAKGYARSATSAREHLGAQWHDSFFAENLTVLEIDTDQHEQLNQNPRRHWVKLSPDYYASSAKPQTSELLEAGTEESLIADVTRDSPPMHLDNFRLHLTAQEAALAAAPEVRAQIALHRSAIADLEHFLRTHT